MILYIYFFIIDPDYEITLERAVELGLRFQRPKNMRNKNLDMDHEIKRGLLTKLLGKQIGNGRGCEYRATVKLF